MLNPSKNVDYLDNLEQLKQCIEMEDCNLKKELIRIRIIKGKHDGLKKYTNYKNI